jgi:hypothetical protein
MREKFSKKTNSFSGEEEKEQRTEKAITQKKSPGTLRRSLFVS